MGKKKITVVEGTDENKTVETIEKEDVQGGAVAENENAVETENSVEEIKSDEAAQGDTQNGTGSTEGVSEEKTETTATEGGNTGEVEEKSEKKSRRASGMGSVYPLTNGKGWGWCTQLSNADKELKKKYGNKLRVLGTAKEYEDACEGARQAIENREELLRKKLEKLGHKFEDTIENKIEGNTENNTENNTGK